MGINPQTLYSIHQYSVWIGGASPGHWRFFDLNQEYTTMKKFLAASFVFGLLASVGCGPEEKKAPVKPAAAGSKDSEKMKPEAKPEAKPDAAKPDAAKPDAAKPAPK